MTFLVLAAGVWADRMSRRRLMLFSDLGRARRAGRHRGRCCCSARAELWHLIVALAPPTARSRRSSAPPPAGSRPRSSRRTSCSRPTRSSASPRTSATSLGPAAAGALIVVLSPGAALAVDAATFVVSAAFLLALREPAREPHPHAARAALLARAARAASPRCARAAGCSASCPPFSRVPLRSRCRACSASAPCSPTRSWAARARGRSSPRASAPARSSARSIGLRWKPRAPDARRDARLRRRLGCQPAIIALAGSTAAIAAFEALAGIAVAIGFAQWETTLGRLIPGRRAVARHSLDWFTTVGIMPLGYARRRPARRRRSACTRRWSARACFTAALFVVALAVARRARACRQESIAS